jgi:hypothetical protein
MKFDLSKPFHLRDSSFSFRSILTTRTPGIFSSSWVPNAGLSDRILITNLTIAQLYGLAAFNEGDIRLIKDRLFLDTKDSLKYFSPKFAPLSYKRSRYKERPEWEDDNLYCYELQFPKPIPSKRMSRYMIDDLNRYFNLDGQFEKREFPSFVLKTERSDKLEVSTESGKPGIYTYRDGHYKVRKQTLDQIARWLGEFMDCSRIVDETQIDFPVSMDFPAMDEHMTLNQMNKVLKAFGLYFVEDVRPIEVFVITEKPAL